MSLSSRLINTFVLALAAVFAWPWGLAFSAIEGSLARPAEGPVITMSRAGATGHPHRLSRSSRRPSTYSAALLQDDSERDEEGDDAGSPHAEVGLFVPADHLNLLAQASPIPFRARPISGRPPSLLHPLRC